MTMNHAAIAITALVALTCLTPATLAQAPVGTACTYQGQLVDGGSPASGNYNMVFKLFDAATLGNQVGPTLTFDGAGGNPPAISVTDGLFTVALDFGAVYDGDQRFLEITVSGSTLTPRQELTATPYARFSAAPWATNGDDIFNVNSGNVGFGGATLPETRLHILSGSDVTSSSGGYIQMGATTAENIALDNNEIQARFNGAPATLALNYEGGDVNMCPSGGKVGVGTAVPGAKLHVKGQGGDLSLEGADHIYLAWYPDGVAAGRKGHTGYAGPTDNNFTIANEIDGAHILLSPTNGNVGVGTTTPVERLDLGGQADGTTLQIGVYTALGESASSGATVLGDNTKPADAPTDGMTFISSHASYGARAIEMRLDKGIVFHANSGVATADAPFSSEVMRITNAGNVGIGTATPSQKLDVAGTAQMTGFKMTGGAPGTGKVLTSDASGVGTWQTPVPAPPAWRLSGNSGTTAGTHFVGTTDGEPLEFKVLVRALRLERGTIGPNVIGGSDDNVVAADVSCAVIGGGGGAGNGPNSVLDSYGFIGGGSDNTVGDTNPDVFNAAFAAIGGGRTNVASEYCAAVAGGTGNSATGQTAFVGGGTSNLASGIRATIGGGALNTASNQAATVAGGFTNEASGNNAAIGGGGLNIASGSSATVPGGSSNEAAGSNSLAAGRNAKATHDGAFVWGDNSAVSDVVSSTTNQFTARCAGGVRFFTNSAMTLGAKLDANATAWSVISDRDVKHNVVAVDPRQVVEQLAAIPISTWTYIDDEHSTPHMGPMAQDFYAAFGLGADDKSISTLDADGVALAAIQGLHQLISEKDAQIAELNARVERLEIALNLLATASKESK